MLQIIVEPQLALEIVFILRGEIVGQEATALAIAWERSKGDRAHKTCIIDVSEVTTMDKDGGAVIRRLASEGARFRARGPITSQVIEAVCKEQKSAFQNGRREFTSMVFCGLMLILTFAGPQSHPVLEGSSHSSVKRAALQTESFLGAQ
jgi:anti-anti-sigma regulatory factor